MTADDLPPAPAPRPDLDTQPFWDSLKAHRLRLQHCAVCGRIRHYPRPVCDACFSMESEWRDVSGHGAVHSWTVTCHAFHPAFRSRLPYILATVDLEAGVRMQAPLRDVAVEQLRVGLPVRFVFDTQADGLVLPAFARLCPPLPLDEESAGLPDRRFRS